MRTFFATLLTVVLVLAAGACKKDAPAPSTPPQTSSTNAPVTPVPAELPAVVATVNGVDVKKEEFQLAIRNLEGRAGQAVPADQRDTVYRQILDRIVGYHLLVQEAKARNIVAPPWEVDKRLTDVKSQFPNAEAFAQMLQQRGLTEARLRQETHDTFTVNTLLDKEFAALPAPSDAEVQTFYDGNKARFHEEPSVRASHILVRVDQNADAAAKQKARSTIEGLQAQLKKGADFAALAKAHSQDPGSATNGGDLGFFRRGQMVPPFEDAAFSAKPGTMTGIVETPFGFHLIKVAESKPGRDVGFDEVKEQIRAYLQQQTREQKTQAFIGQLRSKGKVTILL